MLLSRLRFFGLAVSVSLVGSAALGCSAASDDDSAATGDDANVTEKAEKALTLDNVYLGHADLAAYEPGDAKFHFPVAAEVFYGYRPLDGYRITVSDNCKDSIDVKPLGDGPLNRDAKYSLVCRPSGDATKAFAFTTAASTIGQEDSDTTFGTSFEFIPTVTLKKTGAKTYVLDIQPPATTGSK